MKVRIEISDTVEEPEVVIHCQRIDADILHLQEAIEASRQQRSHPWVFYKGKQEFYFPIENILFFETEGDIVFAHTASDAYRTSFRLYELEKCLPHQFMRVSKSTIVNLTKIYSITRNLTSSSQVHFMDTHKDIYISRHYYRSIRDRLDEQRRSIGSLHTSM